MSRNVRYIELSEFTVNHMSEKLKTNFTSSNVHWI